MSNRLKIEDPGYRARSERGEVCPPEYNRYLAAGDKLYGTGQRARAKRFRNTGRKHKAAR